MTSVLDIIESFNYHVNCLRMLITAVLFPSKRPVGRNFCQIQSRFHSRRAAEGNLKMDQILSNKQHSFI